tara:strand:- start:981 stop:2471 length:1491 start_codon:yes stop_codon:yes gene_type:complete
MAEETGTDWYNISKESMKAQLGVGKKYGGGEDYSTFGTITDVIGNKIEEMSLSYKAEEKRKDKLREAKAKEINNFAKFTLDENFSELGPESYSQAQEEVNNLRQQMFAAIDSDDVKSQQDLMRKLNELKSRHVSDAEAHKTIIESWKDDSADAKAMTEEDLRIMEQFMTNKSKKAIYTQDDPPKMQYQWNMMDENNEPIPELDNQGNQVFDENGDPVYKTETYSAEDLQDRILIKETENGSNYMEYKEALKLDAKNGSFPTDSAILEKVEGIIPADSKALRSWLYSNPSESDGLDVRAYLVDLMNKNFNTYDKLGIDKSQFKDITGDGIVDSNDVPLDLRQQLVEKVMNVEDVEISHGIVSEIYAAWAKNEGLGINNPDLRNQNEQELLGTQGGEDANEILAEQKKGRVEALQMLQDPNSEIFKKIIGMDYTTKEGKNAIAEMLGFDSVTDQIIMPDGNTYSVDHFIPQAKKKKGKQVGGETSNMTDEEKLKYYGA